MAKPKTIAEVISIKNSENKENKQMAKAEKRVKIAGNAVVLTSELKFETIKKLEKYNPDALCLVENRKDEEVEIFRIQTGAKASISKYGIVFATANKNGCANVTFMIPEDITDKVSYVKDNYATILLMLKDIEAVATVASAEFDEAYEKLNEEIEEV
jgi:hypothetical protein